MGPRHYRTNQSPFLTTTQVHSHDNKYFTRWSEALPLKVVNTNQVVSFLNSHIITRFRIPECLVFDNASYFSSLDMNFFTL
jgi:hypothetical protein